MQGIRSGRKEGIGALLLSAQQHPSEPAPLGPHPPLACYPRPLPKLWCRHPVLIWTPPWGKTAHGAETQDQYITNPEIMTQQQALIRASGCGHIACMNHEHGAQAEGVHTCHSRPPYDGPQVLWKPCASWAPGPWLRPHQLDCSMHSPLQTRPTPAFLRTFPT